MIRAFLLGMAGFFVIGFLGAEGLAHALGYECGANAAEVRHD